MIYVSRDGAHYTICATQEQPIVKIHYPSHFENIIATRRNITIGTLPAMQNRHARTPHHHLRLHMLTIIDTNIITKVATMIGNIIHKIACRNTSGTTLSVSLL